MGAVFLLSDIINHKRSLEIRSWSSINNQLAIRVTQNLFLYLTFPIVNVATKPNPNSANTKLKSSSAPVLGSSSFVTVGTSCKIVALNEFERLGLLDTLEIKVETFASFEDKFGLVNILEDVVEPSDSAEAKIA